MRAIITFFFIFYTTLGIAQKHDIKWLVGSYGFDQYLFDFSKISPEIKILENNKFISYLTNLTMSNSKGEGVFFSNGCLINSILYPDSITLINQNDYFCVPPNGTGGVNSSYGIFSLPIPTKEGKFIVFNYEFNAPLLQPISTYNCYHKKFLCHTINVSDSKINIETKDQLLINGCLQKAGACKHANGRDWWIILGDNLEQRFYRWLLTPNGLQQMEQQWIDNPTIDSDSTGGFSAIDAVLFSPDGTKVLLSSNRNGMVLYNFDRCNGLLSNPIKFYKQDIFSWSSIFSPNSRYLYCTNEFSTVINQFDTYSNDIGASKVVVAEWNGYFDPIYGDDTKFAGMQTGYDGKIYIWPGAPYIHIMDYPNQEGLKCSVRQREYRTPAPTSALSIYYPNYRLGPIDGTTCDSLGIDNRPLAIFRYAVDDTLSPLVVNFTDASTYEPTQWQWNFGDGGTSSLTDPVHAFAAPGTYTVCLVVGNAFASDTLCREVQVGTSGVTNMPVLPLVKVAPNPVVTILHVALPAQIHGIMPRFRLTDVWGRLYREVSLRDFDTAVDMSSAAPGVYLWQVLWGTGVTQSGRVVKVE
jgi:PKD repeat protein